jgi:hypothetical protein
VIIPQVHVLAGAPESNLTLWEGMISEMATMAVVSIENEKIQGFQGCFEFEFFERMKREMLELESWSPTSRNFKGWPVNV